MLAVRVRLKDGGNRDHRVKHLAAEYRALAKSRSSCQELLTDPFGPPHTGVAVGMLVPGRRFRLLPLVTDPFGRFIPNVEVLAK